ncbi:50S ribosomal protein L4 [Mycoplasmopsis arginini]|uniref:Large ribosomal subunit protein uL4 n=1 Tax=Mycoplasmopsis arginini TaxID=2094 RepID=A0ABZ2AHX0_MYCAR|nr:50S ribosomal protein L4 [Mycoplasmopsis arginini]MCY2903147.1 50S ribosomal protein L4 [Mycoplasmopsis arginini QMP CG1-2758]MDI3348869.1 50S ribosomal protein L4 [Mycoplasmopsis arginini]MDI3350141.1 50S ribosomal protein L4 [Mycoplasmopsis arginini]MDI3350724.1 50S ribosomal protein L4 [Mycoplasmopsis arginini]MDI3351312.1 50S ribosomal protein L4 [Mycoplasmopsis arginini]
MATVVDKYYISETFDKDRNISFNFKKAKEKVSGNFANFIDAVNEFINVSEKSENDTRVWFHRNGAYSGSVNLEKARIIANRVLEAHVENENAIEFIEKENLVDKSVAKAAKKEENNDLPKSVFGLEKIHTQSVFDAILVERGSKRLATHKVKNRGEVSGTGKKPWPQKHTGNARAGSLRSPIFVGGGRAFGPTTERNYNLKINKKARKNALFSALTMLANANAVLVREYELDKISTRALLVELNKDDLINLNNVLIVSSNEVVFKSAKNLPNVNVSKVTSLSIEALVAADVLVISEKDIKFLEGMAK